MPVVLFCDGFICVRIGFKETYFEIDEPDSTGDRLEPVRWIDLSEGAKDYFASFPR
jgi:hypothetical protein